MQQDETDSKIVEAEVGAAYLLSIDGNDPLEEIRSALIDADNQVNNGGEIGSVDRVASRILCRIENSIVENHQTKIDETDQSKSMIDSFREVPASRVASEAPGRRAFRMLQREMQWSSFSYTLSFDEINLQ